MDLSLPLLESLCPHLSLCNGCPGMETPYVQQCESKHKAVKDTLQYYVEEVGFVPALALQFYRNRSDYWYDLSSQMGFRTKIDPYKAFPAPACRLMSVRAQKAYGVLEPLLKEKGLLPYSLLEQKGYLRYVVFRESKTNGHLVVTFYTFSTDHAGLIQSIAQVLLEGKHAEGVVWVHAPQLNDSVEGTIHQTWGDPLLRETLNGVPFTYDVRCFFQTNPKMAETLQKHVIELVPEKHSVLDLYCGVGLFSIPLIMKGHWVKGIELGNESILWARKNAHALGLNDDSFSFEVGDVPKKIQEFEKTKEQFETIILDPPRSGLSKKIWRRILRLNPKKLIYVSCNLTALKRDLEWLEEYAEFTLNKATAFDLFPHTNHVETVVDITLNQIKEFPKGG